MERNGSREEKSQQDCCAIAASVSCFAPVTNGEDHDPASIEVVEDDISAVTELDDPFAIFGQHILNRTTDLRVSTQIFHAASDGGYSTPGRVGAFRREERLKTGNIRESRCGPN